MFLNQVNFWQKLLVLAVKLLLKVNFKMLKLNVSDGIFYDILKNKNYTESRDEQNYITDRCFVFFFSIKVSPWGFVCEMQGWLYSPRQMYLLHQDKNSSDFLKILHMVLAEFLHVSLSFHMSSSSCFPQ